MSPMFYIKYTKQGQTEIFSALPGHMQIAKRRFFGKKIRQPLPPRTPSLSRECSSYVTSSGDENSNDFSSKLSRTVNLLPR